MVVINDPHIKADPDWPFFCEARDGGHFVKDSNGGVYHGTCWPGIIMFFIISQHFPISVARQVVLFSCNVKL